MEEEDIVVNKYHLAAGWESDPSYVYIGRPQRGSPIGLGNPIEVGKACPYCGVIHGRGETLTCFETYARKRLATEPDYYEAVQNLHGKNLVCFCAPKPCHGDVLEKLAKELDMKSRAEQAGAGGGPKARGSEGPSSASATVTTTAVSPETSTTGAEGPVLIAATGHRPDKLFSSYPYSDENYNRLVLFARQVVIPGLRRKFGNRDIVLMSGMALGWDQAIADAAILEGIPFEVAIPFRGQETIWPHKSQVRYQAILVHARKIHILSETFTQKDVGRLLNERNHFMVHWCDYLVAMWNGSDGGTGNCIRYAEKHNVKAINCWSLWAK